MHAMRRPTYQSPLEITVIGIIDFGGDTSSFGVIFI